METRFPGTSHIYRDTTLSVVRRGVAMLNTCRWPLPFLTFIDIDLMRTTQPTWNNRLMGDLKVNAYCLFELGVYCIDLQISHIRLLFQVDCVFLIRVIGSMFKNLAWIKNVAQEIDFFLSKIGPKPSVLQWETQKFIKLEQPKVPLLGQSKTTGKHQLLLFSLGRSISNVTWLLNLWNWNYSVWINIDHSGWGWLMSNGD